MDVSCWMLDIRNHGLSPRPLQADRLITRVRPYQEENSAVQYCNRNTRYNFKRPKNLILPVGWGGMDAGSIFHKC